MTIQLTKRLAARMLKRGENAVRIKGSAIADASKAITAEDVRALVKSGNVYAIPEKRNISMHGKTLKMKRMKGRKRGPGKKRGTYKARTGKSYPQRVRGQRRVLKELKSDGTIDNQQFKRFYKLVKGGTFASKAQLLNSITSSGVNIDAERFERLRHT
jgi:large subunit ribosomal protein L19e